MIITLNNNIITLFYTGARIQNEQGKFLKYIHIEEYFMFLKSIENKIQLSFNEWLEFTKIIKYLKNRKQLHEKTIIS